MQFPDFPEHEEATEQAINFHAEDVDFPLSDQDRLAKWLFDVADSEEKDLLEVNYIFCSDDYLLDLNREHLDHDYYTDVITFQLTEGVVHGDIFISTDRVADNARELGVPFEQELHRVMVHGVLHLAGYGDKTPEQEAQMRAKEDQYLKELTD